MDRNMDLIVIGAGPAGLSAACAARACGLDVTLIDEQAAPGGQLFRNIETPMAQAILDPKDRETGLALVKRFRESGATYYPNAVVWGLEPHKVSCTMNGKAEELTALDETGRGVRMAQADEGPELVLYQGIQADGRPCVLAFHCGMPHNLQSSAEAENSFNRVLAPYWDTEYRRYAEPQAQAGKPAGVVMARVNEYWNLRQTESANAADCCLNMAAGILQLAVGTDDKTAVLARLEDGLFAVVTVGTPAAQMARKLQDALDNSRREFNISLSRRGSSTVAIAAAEWGETASWDMTLSLVQQHL